MTLTIEPSNSPRWWVDSSYALHPDMKSHMGIFMTISKESMNTSSCKQKLNTKSSTEAELVAIDDAMAQILWTRHFLAAQGKPVQVTTIYQDNKCTILLSENGRASSSTRTKSGCMLFLCHRPHKMRVRLAHNLIIICVC